MIKKHIATYFSSLSNSSDSESDSEEEKLVRFTNELSIEGLPKPTPRRHGEGFGFSVVSMLNPEFELEHKDNSAKVGYPFSKKPQPQAGIKRNLSEQDSTNKKAKTVSSKNKKRA